MPHLVDEIGGKLNVVARGYDDLEAVGEFDDEPRREGLRKVDFGEADFRARDGFVFGRCR